MEFILDEAEETSCESDDFSDGNSVGETNSFDDDDNSVDGNNFGSPSLGGVLSPSVDENNIDGGIMDSLSDQSRRAKQVEPQLVGVRGESTPKKQKNSKLTPKGTRLQVGSTTFERTRSKSGKLEMWTNSSLSRGEALKLMSRIRNNEQTAQKRKLPEEVDKLNFKRRLEYKE